VVRAFEVDRTIIDADVWIGEDELSNKLHVLVIGDEALREALEQAGARLDQLERPYHSNYPI
jgi:predicted solute-binding protein